jgi:hypothetical protein
VPRTQQKGRVKIGLFTYFLKTDLFVSLFKSDNLIQNSLSRMSALSGNASRKLSLSSTDKLSHLLIMLVTCCLILGVEPAKFMLLRFHFYYKNTIT